MDLKPENLVVSGANGVYKEIKIIDFGVSQLTPVNSNHIVGSKEFYAPEIITGQSSWSSIKKQFGKLE